jgi:transposase
LKSDRVDARILADLLRVGYLPEVYQAEEEVMRWRRLVSHRIQLVRTRVRLKNRLLGQLQQEGYQIELSDPFGRAGRAMIDGWALAGWLRRIVDDQLTTMELLSAQITAVDQEVAQIVRADAQMQLLQSVDGVGPFTALALRAVVGEISRFPNAKAFAAYTGLVPGYRQSGEKRIPGPITKQGVSTLRWLLVQAVPHARRHSPYLRRLYYRLCFRTSVSKAKVAVAHALARLIYHVWREARPYYR